MTVTRVDVSKISRCGCGAISPKNIIVHVFSSCKMLTEDFLVKRWVTWQRLECVKTVCEHPDRITRRL